MIENRPLAITVVHGEGRSLWHIVDPSAPEPEQPCILATCHSAAEAEAQRESLRKEGGDA
jgi:hypothetical protein